MQEDTKNEKFKGNDVNVNWMLHILVCIQIMCMSRNALSNVTLDNAAEYCICLEMIMNYE